ncbi:hypothetical protein T492DRAFT_861155 [Pavlovales sp. CCMP2436]|nr:hypothetical protein T492DRAFT_861155 [Pavlovales sp. CCMP2436]
MSTVLPRFRLAAFAGVCVVSTALAVLALTGPPELWPQSGHRAKEPREDEAAVSAVAINTTGHLEGQFGNVCPSLNDQFDCPVGAVAMWTSRANRGRHMPHGVPAGMSLPNGARLCLQQCMTGAFVQQQCMTGAFVQQNTDNVIIP